MPKAAIARTWALILRSTGLRYSRPPITPPTLSAVVDSSSQITVTASGAASTLGSITGYRWRRNGALVNGGTPSASPLVSSGLTAATAFQFTATAIDSAGNESALSASVSATTASSGDTTAPTIPGSHNMSVINSTTLRSAWVASTDSGGSGLAGYLVERATSAAGPWSQVTPSPITAASYDHTGLAGGTTYFARVRAVDNAGNFSNYSSISSATTAAQQSGAITLALRAEYVDNIGADQRVSVNNNGSTVITGIAPLLVTLDATATRAAHSTGNTFAGNWWNNGHRVNFGENRGGTWPFIGAGRINSRDEQEGPPLFGYAYENPGTYQLRYKCRDALGNEATATATVVVLAPPAATIVEPTAGGWPTPVSGTHYGLRAGANYSSFGAWNLRRVHNVLVSKVGAGADPIVSEVQIGNETTGDLLSVRERTRHVRLLNIDIGRYTNGIYGGLHCGAVNGRVRRVDQANSRAEYQNNNTNATQRAQIAWPRGFYLFNTGLMSDSGLTDYLMIGQHNRMWHSIGVRFQHPGGGANNHILRNTQHQSTMRFCQVFSTFGPYSSRIKMQAEGTELWAADSELIGPLTGAGTSWYRYSNSYNVVESCQFGGVGDVPPFGTTLSTAPQNGTVGAQPELHEFNAVENCADTRPAASIVRGGRELGARNLRNPDNSAWQASEIDWGAPRIPAGAFGPYITETVNSRPLPSAF